jgi:hypothetical protein
MLLHFFVRFLEILFFVGLAGSFIVAIVAFVGDVREFFEKE